MKWQSLILSHFVEGEISNVATCTVVFMLLILLLVSFLLVSTEKCSFEILNNLHFPLLEWGPVSGTSMLIFATLW